MAARLRAPVSSRTEGARLSRPSRWSAGVEPQVNVQLRLGLTLCFLNLEGVDSVVGFEGTPWHAHGLVPFTTVPPEFIECDELDLLTQL